MHEIALIRAAAAALVREADGTAVGSVDIAVDHRVDRELAEEVWRDATIATSLEGSVVNWLPSTDTLACLECHAQYEGSKLDRCPSCGGDGLVVEAAAEVAVLDWQPVTR